jgi:hypothetical protein
MDTEPVLPAAYAADIARGINERAEQGWSRNATDVYDGYVTMAQRRGVEPVTAYLFSRALISAGLSPGKEKNRRVWRKY